MNKVIVGVSFFVATLSAVLLWQRLTVVDESDVLTVGIAAGYAPWVSMNEQGEYAGFDIDVIKAVAKLMNKKLKLEDLGSMTSLLMALDQGSIDAVIWGMSMTKERRARYTMIHYQGEAITTYPLLFWKTIPKGVTRLEDMKGKVVCVEPSSAQFTILKKYDGIEQMPTERVDDALLALQYGKADAAFVEQAIAQKFMRKNPELKKIDIPLAQSDQELGVGIMLQKAKKELAEKMTAAVELLKKSGTIQAYEKKWGLE